MAKDLNTRKSMPSNYNHRPHLNRMKNMFYIPLQLQTLKVEEKMYNIDNLNLQLKNKVRFKFDSLKDIYSNRQNYIMEE